MQIHGCKKKAEAHPGQIPKYAPDGKNIYQKTIWSKKFELKFVISLNGLETFSVKNSEKKRKNNFKNYDYYLLKL